MAICSNRLYVENWRTRYVLREFLPEFGHASPVGGLRGACAELRSLFPRVKTIGGLRGACAELRSLFPTVNTIGGYTIVVYVHFRT